VKSVYYFHGLFQKRAPLKKNLYLKFKRWIDVIAALGLLIILSPLLIFIGLLIKLESSGPLLFKQVRLGLDSKPFTIYKFRTMVNHAPRNIPTNALNDPHTYVTRIGRFLRLFSLDELPQLICLGSPAMPRSTEGMTLTIWSNLIMTRTMPKTSVQAWI